MDSDHFAAEVLTRLPYTANDQQVATIASLARFVMAPPEGRDRVFMLNGYAGTGKSSIMGALVRALPAIHCGAVLLAPTGRAAKVFGAYAGRAAMTIHRKIYKHSLDGAAGSYSGAAPVQDNKHRNCVFIVDEASMIGDGDSRGNNLLQDLIQYVYTGENCRMVLLGDTAQLPPVGSTLSPAMNRDILRSFGLKVTAVTLTEVARQSLDSGILFNATLLRKAMLLDNAPVPKIISRGFDDIILADPEDMIDLLDEAYRRDGIDETIVITRSNRSATDFNRAIRAQVLYREEELCVSDLLIVAKNNYYWPRFAKGLSFIANGDIVSIVKVYGSEMKYGCRFADVRLALTDGDTEFDAKIIIDPLYTDTPALPQDSSNRLFNAIINDGDRFSPSTPYEARLRALRDDPYWNALQVKYAYAVTCHKAQGGQWHNVFVDVSYVPADALGLEFYRWLYTAVTRARTRLYLISPPEDMLSQI